MARDHPLEEQLTEGEDETQESRPTELPPDWSDKNVRRLLGIILLYGTRNSEGEMEIPLVRFLRLLATNSDDNEKLGNLTLEFSFGWNVQLLFDLIRGYYYIYQKVRVGDDARWEILEPFSIEYVKPLVLAGGIVVMPTELERAFFRPRAREARIES
jgi:hypothetical protein